MFDVDVRNNPHIDWENEGGAVSKDEIESTLDKNLPPVHFTVNDFKCISPKAYLTTRQILEIAGYDIGYYIMSKNAQDEIINHFVLDDRIFIKEGQIFFARLRGTA